MTDIGNPQKRPTEWLPFKFELEYKLLTPKQPRDQDEPKTTFAQPFGNSLHYWQISPRETPSDLQGAPNLKRPPYIQQ